MAFPADRILLKTPHLVHWMRLDGFTCWSAMMLGIATGCLLPPAPFLSFYHSIFIAAMVLLIVAGIFFSHPVRFGSFFILGIVCILQTEARETAFYAALPQDGAILDKGCFGAQALTGAVATGKGHYAGVVHIDTLRAGDGRLIVVNKDAKALFCSKVQAGMRITGTALFLLPQACRNPGGFNEFALMRANRLWGTLMVDSLATGALEITILDKINTAVRKAEAAALDCVKNNEYRAILQASVSGENTLLSAPTRTLLINAGIYHLIAISGFNLAVLIGFVFAIFLPVPVGRNVKVIVSIALVWWYVSFTGPIPSLVRAAIMTTIMLAATLFQRKNYALNALGIAGILWLCFAPLSLFNPSYQLSFAATFGLIAFYPVIGKWSLSSKCAPVDRFVVTPLWAALTVSLAAFILTAPILVY
ncbi:MAG: ComEC/Rec2 family competence protein, partial [Chitinivibrionales bacterium]|nr:ComEC/Rec2 family competence protein [Chitinivibrionales bacterium]